MLSRLNMKAANLPLKTQSQLAIPLVHDVTFGFWHT